MLPKILTSTSQGIRILREGQISTNDYTGSIFVVIGK